MPFSPKKILRYLLRRRLGVRFLLFFSVVALLSSSVLLLFLQRDVKRRMSEEVQIVGKIGEILLYDEVLTMSARLNASSGDSAYERRYQEFNAKLDQAIQATLSLFDDAQALKAVQQTNEANNRLVAMEMKSFELTRQGHGPEAFRLLHSDKYLEDKKVYSDGMHQAFAILREHAASSVRRAMFGIDFSQVTLLVSLITLVLTAWLNQKIEHQRDREQAQLHALRVTMASVMDAFVNLLNGLQWFRMQAEESGAIGEKAIREFDELIENCQQQLKAMGEMEKFSKKEIGFGIETLDYPEDYEIKNQ